MPKKRQMIGFAILLSFFTFGCAAEPSLPNWITKSGENWQPPPEGVVRDGRTAISIARAVWISMHPEIKKRIGSDEVWQIQMTATLRNGVWEVSNKMKPNEIGGALFFYISQRDGRVLGVFLTQ